MGPRTRGVLLDLRLALTNFSLGAAKAAEVVANEAEAPAHERKDRPWEIRVGECDEKPVQGDQARHDDAEDGGVNGETAPRLGERVAELCLQVFVRCQLGHVTPPCSGSPPSRRETDPGVR
jgi:hypothetical protein